MSFFVDTSIVIASQLPDEPGHQQAIRWLEAVEGLHMADHLPLELANALSKIARRGRMSLAHADAVWLWWNELPAQPHATAPHLAHALKLSAQHGLHVYDLLHLLTAREAGRTLVTLNKKLHEQAKTVRLGKWVALLG